VLHRGDTTASLCGDCGCAGDGWALCECARDEINGDAEVDEHFGVKLRLKSLLADGRGFVGLVSCWVRCAALFFSDGSGNSDEVLEYELSALHILDTSSEITALNVLDV
jgi:hypothetical protein